MYKSRIVVFIFAVLGFQTGNASVDSSTMLTLVEVTDNFCSKKVKQTGSSTSIAADGELSVEINKYLKNLVDTDGRLSGSIDKTEWNNVPQDELLSAIQQADGCRENILAMLLKHAEPVENKEMKERRNAILNEISKINNELDVLYSQYDPAKTKYDIATHRCATVSGLNKLIACDGANKRRPEVQKLERTISRIKERRAHQERLLNNL